MGQSPDMFLLTIFRVTSPFSPVSPNFLLGDYFRNFPRESWEWHGIRSIHCLCSCSLLQLRELSVFWGLQVCPLTIALVLPSHPWCLCSLFIIPLSNWQALGWNWRSALYRRPPSWETCLPRRQRHIDFLLQHGHQAWRLARGRLLASRVYLSN